MIQPPQQLGMDIQNNRQPQPVNLPGQTADNQQLSLYGGGPLQSVQRTRQAADLANAQQSGFNSARADWMGAQAKNRDQNTDLNQSLSAQDHEHQFATEQANYEVNQYQQQKNLQIQRASAALTALRQKMAANLAQIGQDSQFNEGQQALGSGIQAGASIAGAAIQGYQSPYDRQISDFTQNTNNQILGGISPIDYLRQNANPFLPGSDVTNSGNGSGGQSIYGANPLWYSRGTLQNPLNQGYDLNGDYAAQLARFNGGQ